MSFERIPINSCNSTTIYNQSYLTDSFKPYTPKNTTNGNTEMIPNCSNQQ